MSSLTDAHWPWARRASEYDPMTPLEKLLLSPLRILIQCLYFILVFLRGSPFKPPQHKPAIRTVCISDTHTNTPTIPEGDLLIHAGDLTNAGNVKEIQAQLDWMNSLPHKHKVFIAGNHDSFFDPKSRKPEDKNSPKLNFYDLHYLQNQSVHLKFKGGRSLSLYGCGDVPKCGGNDFAFQYQRLLHPWAGRIPLSTDILITHTPPRYHMDLDHGCVGLLEEIWRVRPRLHVFGHIHASHGREPVFWDAGQAAYERVMSRSETSVLKDCIPSAAWLDGAKVLWFGIKGILWQHLMVGTGGANSGLLINAALVSWKGVDVISNPVEVVNL